MLLAVLQPGEQRRGSAAAGPAGLGRGDRAQGYGETEARAGTVCRRSHRCRGCSASLHPAQRAAACAGTARLTSRRPPLWGHLPLSPSPRPLRPPHGSPGPEGWGEGAQEGVPLGPRGWGGRGKAGEDFWLQTLVWRVGSGCLGALTTLMGLREVMLSLLRLLVQESQRGYSPFSNTNCSPLQLACS